MEIIILIVILIFSVILHEVMHGYMADRLGDSTARDLGRLTLNPIPHIDPLMSVLLPTMLILSGSPILFGAAKPVPVNYFNLKEGRKDMALVALAGPLTNIFLAVIASLLIRIIFPEISLMRAVSEVLTNTLTVTSVADFTLVILVTIIYINLVLGILNLIPIPPLDGSKVVSFFLPENLASAYYSLEQYGIIILFFLLFFPLGGFSLGDILGKLVFNAIRLLGT